MKTFEISDDTAFRGAVDYLTGRTRGAEMEEAIAAKTQAAQAIVDAVRERGDAVIAEFTERFDGVSLNPDQFELSADEIDGAAATVEPELLAILERANENIRRFHAKNLRESWEEMDDDDLSIVDVEACIHTGTIVARYRDHVTVGYRYLVEGQTSAGDPSVVVGKLSAGGTLVIVNANRIEGAGRKV